MNVLEAQRFESVGVVECVRRGELFYFSLVVKQTVRLVAHRDMDYEFQCVCPNSLAASRLDLQQKQSHCSHEIAFQVQTEPRS